MKKFITFGLLFFMVVSGKSQVKSGDTNPLFIQLAKSKPDSSRISIFLQLASYYFDDASLVNHMDSVEFYLKQARLLNERFHIINFQNQINILSAKHYWAQYPGEDIKKVFLPVIDTCKKTGDMVNEETAWNELVGKIGNDAQSIPFKITCYQNAMTLARQMNDINGEVHYLRNIADLHLQQHKLDLAETELFQILKEEKRINPNNIMFSYDLLTAIYITKGQYDKALSYGFKTIKMMEFLGDSEYVDTFYGRLAEIYRALGKKSESIEWLKKSLTINIWKNNTTNAYRVIRRIVIILLGEGKPQEALNFVLNETAKRKPVDINDRRLRQKMLGDCYNALKKYDLAEKCYVEMIRLGNEQKSNYPIFDKAQTNTTMGNFYFTIGSYNQARPFLEMALKNFEENGTLQYVKETHLSLFKVDSALRDYVEAIKHLQQSNLLGDSLFSIARNKQIEELQIAYKTDQKDKDFRLLQGKEKLAQVQLQHAESSRNWMIAGAFMLLIIAGLLYRQALMRKKNNKIITRKNAQLQNYLSEKEWLLKEIHHRVKNNLQVVMSLLNSQSAYINNEEALTAIHDSQHRVHAMSLIHQKLYNSENVSSIDMSSYIHELVSYLRDSFDAGQRIRFELNIAPLEMDVSQAVPLGLILNEAITNSIKYAFPGGRSGVISISLSNVSSDHYLLIISDNGIGIPDSTIKKPGSLGMSLMKGLSEDLEGNLSIDNENGTTLKISFVYEKNINRHSILAETFVSNN